MSDEKKRSADDVLADLARLKDEDGYESAHIEADNLMMEFARIMGRDDITDAFDAVGKWYA